MKKALKIIALLLVIATILLSLIYIFFDYLPKKQQEEQFKKMMEDYYNAKVESYEQENKSITPGEIDVAFIGDSLTDGYDVQKYYPEFNVANRGIGGDTTFGVEKRLQVSLYDLQPKVVVMLIGANNPGTMFENYENILISFRDNLPNSEIVLISLTSMGGTWGKNNHLAAYNNVKIKALAEKYGYHFVDVYTPLLNQEIDEIYPEYTTDGGHLTPLGYEVMTSQIKPVLNSILLNEK